MRSCPFREGKGAVLLDVAVLGLRSCGACPVAEIVLKTQQRARWKTAANASAASLSE